MASQTRNTFSQGIKEPFVLIKRDATRRRLRPECAKHPVGLITESSNGSVVRATNAIEREALRGALISCGGIDTRRVRDPHSTQGVDIGCNCHLLEGRRSGEWNGSEAPDKRHM